MIEIRLENGASYTITHSDDFAEAIAVAKEGLEGCVRGYLKPENIVRQTVVRTFQACALCGSGKQFAKELKMFNLEQGNPAPICAGCFNVLRQDYDETGRKVSERSMLQGRSRFFGELADAREDLTQGSDRGAEPGT